MLLRTFILLTFIPSALFAEAYGTADGCAQYQGEVFEGDRAVVWSRTEGTITIHFNVCQITDVIQIGSGGVSVAADCAGEGEAWEAWYHIYSLADGRHYKISPEANTGVEHDLFLCE